MNFWLKNGVPCYNLKYKANTVIEDSKLGLRIYKDAAFKSDAEFVKPEEAALSLIKILQ